MIHNGLIKCQAQDRTQSTPRHSDPRPIWRAFHILLEAPSHRPRFIIIRQTSLSKRISPGLKDSKCSYTRIVTERNPNDLRQTVRTSIIGQPVAARYRFRDASHERRGLPRGTTTWNLRDHHPGDLVHDGIVMACRNQILMHAPQARTGTSASTSLNSIR